MGYRSERTGEKIDALLDKVERGDFDIKVDTFLSETSNNAIANETVTKEFHKKIDKVEGKGLSSNDFTDEDKELVQKLKEFNLMYPATYSELKALRDADNLIASLEL